MTKNNLLFLFVILLGLTACNEEEAVPAYLHLTEWSFTTLPGQGSSKQKIEGGHVFVNGQSIGVYQLPATIPVVGDGETDINVFPMVKLNGMVGIDVAHPYFQQVDTSVFLTPTEEDTLQLSTRYIDVAEIGIEEDFESGHFFIDDLDMNETTKFVLDRDDPFEGEASGLAIINEDNPVIEAGWHQFVANPQDRGAHWVELNYKTNITFVIGIRAFVNGTWRKFYEAGINPRDEWNKIYFDLTDTFFLDPAGLYQVVIVGLWTPDQGVEEGRIQVDNVKLVRRK